MTGRLLLLHPLPAELVLRASRAYCALLELWATITSLTAITVLQTHVCIYPAFAYLPHTPPYAWHKNMIFCTAVNPEDLHIMTHYQQNMPPAFGCLSSAVNYLRVLSRHLNFSQLLQAIKPECAVVKSLAAFMIFLLQPHNS
jgi:hypothetical protein